MEIDRLTAYFDGDDRNLEKTVRNVNKLLDDFEARVKKFGGKIPFPGFSSGNSNNQSISKATQMLNRYELMIDRLSGKQVELKKLNQILAQPGVSAKIDDATKALIRQKAAMIDNLRAAKTNKSGPNWSGAGSQILAGVTGGLIGGGIAGTVLTAANAVTELTRKSVELGAKSVQLAGNFQVTTNALAVFTGSVTSAKNELEAVEQLASNTPGLRLESAQVGYQQLRAMGFQAEITKKLLAGLANQKIISGVDEGAVNRVIVNLIQLSSGSHRATQDLKEMVLSMPGLLSVFREAFKTTDFSKIGQMFKENPEKAIEKLTESMANSNRVSGGFNDGLGKAEDAFISAGKKFGEPLLEPLTRDLIKLTDYLGQNKNAFADWGLAVADTYRGLIQIGSEFDTRQDTFIGNSTRRLIELTKYLTPAITISNALATIGEAERKRQEEIFQQFEKFDVSNPNFVSDFSKRGFVWDANQPFVPNSQGKTKEQAEQEEQVTRVMDQTNLKLLAALEKAEQQRMEVLKSFFDEKMSVISANQSLELAALDTYIANTLEQERTMVNRRAAVQTKYLKQQLTETRKYYREALTDKSLTDQDRQKLEHEAAQKLRSLNVQIQETELRRQREVAEKERAIAEKRRQAQIEALTLMTRQMSQIYDRRIYDTERGLESQGDAETAGYNRLIQLTQTQNNKLTEILRAQYALRLADEKLSEEERENLKREANLAEQDLAEQNRRRILEITDRKNRDYIDRMRRAAESQRQLQLIDQSTGQAIFERLLKGNLSGKVFSGQINEINSVVKKYDELKKAVSDLEYDLSKAAEAHANLLGGEYTTEDFDKSAERIDKLRKQLNAAKDGLQDFRIKNNFADAFKEYEALANSISTSNLGMLDSFEDIQKAFIKQESINKFNILWDDILKLQNRARNEEIAGNQIGADDLRKQIDEKIKQISELSAQMNKNLAEFEKNSISGIKAYIDNINPLDKLDVIYSANQSIWENAKQTYNNILALESKYYENSTLWALKRKEAILQFEREIYEAQQNTLLQSQISIDQRLRKSLAELPTYANIYKDFIGNLPVQMADSLNQIAQQWDGTWKGLADVAKRTFGQMLIDLAADYGRSAFAQLFGRLIGVLLGAFSGGGGDKGINGALSHGTPPGFASGGFPAPNRISIVGEQGPELFIPTTRGRILSNEDSRLALNGGSNQTFNNTTINNTIHAPRNYLPQKSLRQLNDSVRNVLSRS